MTVFPVILIEFASIVASGAIVGCYICGNHTTWMPNIEKIKLQVKEGNDWSIFVLTFYNTTDCWTHYNTHNPPSLV